MAEEKASVLEEITASNDGEPSTEETTIDLSGNFDSEENAQVTTTIKTDENPIEDGDVGVNVKIKVQTESQMEQDNTPGTEAGHTINEGESVTGTELVPENDGTTKNDEKKTRPKKPLSPSMQRLTAAKKSPDLSTKTGPTADERKIKAQSMRKSKISEHRNKEDDKRAAVIERKKRLEEEERLRKEALLKKITADTSVSAKDKKASMKRYSSSTSNLTLLKKTKSKSVDIDTGDDHSKSSEKPMERPSSSLSRTRPSSSSSLTSKINKPAEKPKSTTSVDKKLIKKTTDTGKKAAEVKRPLTAEPNKKTTTTRPPSARMSLNPRPASAIGSAGADRRKTLPAKTVPVKAKTTSTTTPPSTKPPSAKPIKKTETMKTTKAQTISPKTDTSSIKSPDRPTSAKKPTDKNNEISKDTKRPSTSSSKKDKKEAATKSSTGTTPKKTGKSENKKSITDNKMTEEEAKKALQERRKKAKEEAEAKAQAERERDEMERKQREEEEKRLAEQLKLEEEKQAALLEQLKAEEDERKRKMVEEKEQKEREEKERLETEARQREEEIQRKAKIEAERIQKEQQKKDQESEAERIERKKRVELIMARVSASRTGSSSTETSAKPPSPQAEEPTSTSPVAEEALSPPLTEATRLKVDGILKSKGLGKSLEDLLSEVSKEEEKPTTSEKSESDLPVETNVKDGTVDSINDNNTPAVTIELDGNLEKDVKNNDSNDSPAVNEIQPASDTLEEKSSNSPVSITLPQEGQVEPPPTTETIPEIDIVISNNNNNLSSSVVGEPVGAWTENQEAAVVGSEIETEIHVDNTVVETTEQQPDTESKECTPEEHQKGMSNGTPLIEEDLTNKSEKEQWADFEQKMNKLQLDEQPNKPDAEEAKLWKVAEGKVELSECF